MTGLVMTAMIDAQKQTGQTTGAAYEAAFQKDYSAELKPLPWAVVSAGVKQAKSSMEIITPALILGSVQAGLEPAVARTHQLSNDLAWGLISARVTLKRVLPLQRRPCLPTLPRRSPPTT
ncbi:MAG: hypothetical protein WBD67_06200 [Terracidiphilus sp.]